MLMSLELIETGSFVRQVAGKRADLIRVLSWNIARGCRLNDITEFLAETHADLILLQESDSNARRTGFRNVAAEIASSLRMNYAFGIEFEELSQGSRQSPAYHGQATLSVLPLSDCRILRFGSQSRFWHPYRWVPSLAVLQRRLGGRMALVTNVEVGERTLVIYNLHLESRSAELCRAQLTELLHDTCRYDCHTPVLVGGDFNLDVTESSVASAIQEMCFFNPFKHEHPQTARSQFLGRALAIDSILVRGPVHATSACVHSSVPASDHFPLSVTLQLL